VVVAVCSLCAFDAFVLPGLRYPLHASCKIAWSWPSTNCSTVMAKILDQIDLWKTRDNCPNDAGEKCLYTLTNLSPTTILVHHTSPKKGYIDDLSFAFVDGGTKCDCNARPCFS
jgi:hypothetical protein